MRRSTKKVIFQALVASVLLGVFGLGFNALNSTAKHEVAFAVEPDIIEVDPRIRAREEHGEDGGFAAMEEDAESVGGDMPMGAVGETMQPPDYERERREHEMLRKRIDIINMPRAEAIKRADELHRRLEKPDLPPQEREEAEQELGMVLEEHFAPAAGEPEPIMEEPRETIVAQLDINNVFNKVWGLFQALILAWVPYKLGQRKKQEKKEALLTESVMDRIDEELIKRHRTNKVKQSD